MSQTCPDCGGPLAATRPRADTPDAEYDPERAATEKDLVAEDATAEEDRSDRVSTLVCTDCGAVMERPTA